MLNMLKRLWKEEEGQAMTEYGLILALVAVAVVLVLGFLGDELVAKFKDVTGRLQSAQPKQ